MILRSARNIIVFSKKFFYKSVLIVGIVFMAVEVELRGLVKLKRYIKTYFNQGYVKAPKLFCKTRNTLSLLNTWSFESLI